MRMRAAATIALAIVGIALAGEPAVISLEEWQERVAEVMRRDETTVAKAERLRAAADEYVIERHGRVLDVRPYRWKDRDTVVIDVCGPYDGERIEQFVAPHDERDVAAAWGRWDVLRWRVKPTVADDGDVTYDASYDVLADLHREPRGEPPVLPLPSPSGNGGQWRSWLLGYVGAIIKQDWSKVERLFAEGSAKTWVLPAIVRRTQSDGVLVSFTGDVRVWGTRSRRCWGVPEGAEVVVRAPDPQLVGDLKAGDGVEVLAKIVEPQSANAYQLRDRDGHFRLDLRLWRRKK